MSGGVVVYFTPYEYVTIQFNVQPALDSNFFTYHLFFFRDNISSFLEWSFQILELHEVVHQCLVTGLCQSGIVNMSQSNCAMEKTKGLCSTDSHHTNNP